MERRSKRRMGWTYWVFYLRSTSSGTFWKFYTVSPIPPERKKVADDYKALLPNHLSVSFGPSSYPIGAKSKEVCGEEGGEGTYHTGLHSRLMSERRRNCTDHKSMRHMPHVVFPLFCESISCRFPLLQFWIERGGEGGRDGKEKREILTGIGRRMVCGDTIISTSQVD